MKILKYIFITFLLLVGLFFCMGLCNPEITYGHTIETSKTIDEAWSVHQDETKFPLWLEGFKSIELVEGSLGEVGSKYRVIVQPEGQPDFEMIETIASIKAKDHIRLTFNSEMMNFDQTTRFKQVSGGTTITTESLVSAKGLFMQSMFATMNFLSNSFQKQEEKNINELKKVIDNNVDNYGQELDDELFEEVVPEG